MNSQLYRWHLLFNAVDVRCTRDLETNVFGSCTVFEPFPDLGKQKETGLDAEVMRKSSGTWTFGDGDEIDECNAKPKISRVHPLHLSLIHI